MKSPSKRTLEQNALMWSLLTQLSEQLPWYGKKRSPMDWKDICTAHLRKHELVPGIDPGTIVPLGMHTSKMRIEELGNLIELIYAFGAEKGVTFRECA